jgi:hypothetical protein
MDVQEKKIRIRRGAPSKIWLSGRITCCGRMRTANWRLSRSIKKAKPRHEISLDVESIR